MISFFIYLYDKYVIRNTKISIILYQIKLVLWIRSREDSSSFDDFSK